jgi:SH3-like domain-containing protein
MKKRTILAAVLLLAAAAIFAAPKQMSVNVKETQVRATPSHFAKVLAVVKYGDRLEVVQEQSGWAKVSLSGGKLQGWVSLSALQDKRIALTAGQAGSTSGASSGEVALAGKGFNKEVEAQYKDEKQLDYTWVDRMEGYRVSPEQVLAFLQAGGLPAPGGAQ